MVGTSQRAPVHAAMRRRAAGSQWTTSADSSDNATILTGYDQYVAVYDGALYQYFGESGGAWTLLWVDTTGALLRGDTGGAVAVTLAQDGPAPFDAAYGTALARSTFTAANGTAVSAYTPEVGAAWTVHAGTLTISGGRVVPDGAFASAQVATVEGAADGVLEGVLRYDVSASRSQYVVFRYQDANNYWFAGLYSGALLLYELTGGAVTQRASQARSLVDGTEYHIVVTFDDTSIAAHLPALSGRITYTSSQHQAATRCGLRMYSGGIGAGNIAADAVALYPRRSAAYATLDHV